MFKEDVEDSYVKLATTALSNYLDDNKKMKDSIKDYVNNQDYDEVIKLIMGLTIKEEVKISKETLPIEGVIPFKISSDVYENVISRLAWSIINNDSVIFDNVKASIKTNFIQNSGEIEIY